MKTVNNLLLVLLVTLFFTNVSLGKTYRQIDELPFSKGEELSYTVSYGFFTVAEVSLKVDLQTYIFNQRDHFHVVGKGKSVGGLSWFFKVDDRYETFFDSKALISSFFIRRVNEDGFIINRDITFDHEKNQAHILDTSKEPKKEKTISITENTQDMISALYYARSLDFSKVKVRDQFEIPMFFDYENYPMRIKYVGKKVVKTAVGKINCLEFRPMLQKGRVFKEEEDMTIWISDDVNKVPVRIQSNILVGSIKVDLISASHLVDKLNRVK